MEFISEGIFWKIFKNEDFGFKFFENGQILMPFSGLAPSKLKIHPLPPGPCGTEKSVVLRGIKAGIKNYVPKVRKVNMIYSNRMLGRIRVEIDRIRTKPLNVSGSVKNKKTELNLYPSTLYLNIY